MNLNPNNPLFQQMFGGFNNFNTAFTNFANNPMFRNPGMSPQQIVQQKLNSGEMSQEQFNQLRVMANQIMGINN